MTAFLDLDTPIASLCLAAGVTRADLADKLGLRAQSVRDGETIQLRTLRRAAEALGQDLEIRVVPKEKSSAVSKKQLAR